MLSTEHRTAFVAGIVQATAEAAARGASPGDVLEAHVEALASVIVARAAERADAILVCTVAESTYDAITRLWGAVASGVARIPPSASSSPSAARSPLADDELDTFAQVSLASLDVENPQEG